MNEWILICNSKYFDLKKAFETTDFITWPLTDGIAVGDVVYFFVTSPYRAILYKCEVENVDCLHMDNISKECVAHALFYEGSQIYMRLRKIVAYPENLLTEEELQKIGIQHLQITLKAPKGFDKFIAEKEKLLFGRNKKKRKFLLWGVIGIIAVAVIVLVIYFVAGGNKKPEVQSSNMADGFENGCTVSADSTTIFVGESTEVVFHTGDSTYQNEVIWISSDDGIATVDGNGKVIGASAGQVSITGIYYDQTASISIVVEANDL